MSRTDDALVALRQIIRIADLRAKQLARAVQLTATQLLVLQTVEGGEDVTPGAIAREVNLTQATITTILDRLEKRGLLQRERSETDRRKIFVRLTAEGARAIHSAPVPLHESFVRGFERLRPWEQSMLVASLQRVAVLMEAEDLDAAPVLDVGSLDRREES